MNNINSEHHQLFNSILKGEVVLWIGAGFSKNAGYPLGSDLCKILMEDLSHTQKEIIINSRFEENLPEFTEHYVMFHNGKKNQLLKQVKKIFDDVTPINIDYHRDIAKIPMITNIITTNYDTLFENVYGSKISVLKSSTDVPLSSDKKVNLFKVHGDFNDVKNLILTKSDYNNFFTTGAENSVYWNEIRSKIANNDILFLGYGLNDPNINIIFDKIANELNEHSKTLYYHNYQNNEYYKNNLIQRGFTIIDTPLNILFKELSTFLNDNIYKALTTDEILVEDFIKYCSGMDLIASVKKSEQLTEVTNLSSARNELILAQFKFNTTDKKLIDTLNQTIENGEVCTIKLTPENATDIELRYEGILFHRNEEIEFRIEQAPTKEGKIDLRFDCGFEIENITFKLYQGGNNSNIKLFFSLMDIEIKPKSAIIGCKDFEVIPTHKPMCGTLEEEIKIYTLLEKWTNNENFEIYFNGDQIFRSQSMFKVKFESNIYSFYKEFFENLRHLERSISYKFKKISYSSINEDLMNNTKIVAAYLKKEKLVNIYSNDREIILTDFQFSTKVLSDFKSKTHTFMLTYSPNYKIEIFGKQFDIGSIRIVYPHCDFKRYNNKTKTLELLNCTTLLQFQFLDSNDHQVFLNE